METAPKKRILLVDDDQDLVFQTRIQLEAAGFDVIDASSGAEAKQLLNHESFDLAVVDLMMEEVDAGFTLCYEIKKKDASIPVIMATGVTHETGLKFDDGSEDARAWIKADVMLAKPIRFEQLLNKIKKFLKGA